MVNPEKSGCVHVSSAAGSVQVSVAAGSTQISPVEFGSTHASPVALGSTHVSVAFGSTQVLVAAGSSHVSVAVGSLHAPPTAGSTHVWSGFAGSAAGSVQVSAGTHSPLAFWTHSSWCRAADGATWNAGAAKDVSGVTPTSTAKASASRGRRGISRFLRPA
jgi:hypothetical protein